ncbi:aminopeptidase N [Pacificimonas sp. WHA3]|uniref:Aminopeptidase N n=1 Tax=Pacificimonas pallii TaxID=2827236 RepID=A0ABS6SAD7_9SPHN|nr:aminopeptidase N [Pacificimonas pallii]MBV7255350.1 aminopeptidase N [Pacificimonas pallii]
MDILPADASPPPQASHITHRKDYQPPAWLVPDAALTFDLGAKRTKVSARLNVVRGAGPRGPLILNAEALELLSVSVGGRKLSADDYSYADDRLTLVIEGDEAVVETEVRIAPDRNTQLMGLYASGGILCTQCEAEGFRRITPFPDRPDILSRYTVTLRADRTDYPVLLSNGDPGELRDLGDGRHEIMWTDPHPKPCYLFAAVAGKLAALKDSFTTMSGRIVALGIWVRPGDEPRCQHAMRALKDSMAWDERTYGREYDLDVFNIVAVDDFNFGAMENKGLNIFNSKYVLADRETATDTDFDNIAAIVAHEYFHNWTGNRITCRDWFQLSLKEGLTVFRDQSFSADHGSAAVKRIQDVRTLRIAQFAEDAGPLAHSIRPDSYQEISNFYTSTIYNKGAEVIRMMATLAGAERYRAGTDLYFERHDGEAATCEDWISAIEDGAALDLSQFRRWYTQAGTPTVNATLTHDADARTATLTLSQDLPNVPNAGGRKPMHIPLKTALFGRESGARLGKERLIELKDAAVQIDFGGIEETPILSINRAFSAPVSVKATRAPGELAFLSAHDDDPFARYEAMQELMSDWLVKRARGEGEDAAAIIDAVTRTLDDQSLDDAFRAEAILTPADTLIVDRIGTDVSPRAVVQARRTLRKTMLSGAGHERLMRIIESGRGGSFDLSPEAKGKRRLRAVALGLLFADPGEEAIAAAAALYDKADNMTDRMAAMTALAGSDTAERVRVLADFHARFRSDANVIDKWFTVQAMAETGDPLATTQHLMAHEDYSASNPNRFRALIGGFAANMPGFHAEGGAGYRFLADQILTVDRINPQTAARFVAPLGRWRRFRQDDAAAMRAELQRMLDAPGLSKDVREMAEKSLA